MLFHVSFVSRCVRFISTLSYLSLLNVNALEGLSLQGNCVFADFFVECNFKMYVLVYKALGVFAPSRLIIGVITRSFRWRDTNVLSELYLSWPCLGKKRSLSSCIGNTYADAKHACSLENKLYTLPYFHLQVITYMMCWGWICCNSVLIFVSVYTWVIDNLSVN